MKIPSLHSTRVSLHILAAAVVLGILLPPLASLARPLLFPSIFFLMLFTIAQIDIIKTGAAAPTSSVRVLSIAAWQMLVLPLAAGLIHMLVPFSGAWSEVMVLTACAGTIFGAPAFAQLIGADARLVLLGVLASTLLMPLVLPLVALWALGGSAEFDFYAYGLRLFVFLVVPAVIAGLYHGLTGPARRSRHAGFLRLGSVFFLSLFAVAVMDGVGQRLAAQTQAVLELLLLAFGIHIVFFASALAVFSAIDTRTALPAGILCGYRNLGLLLAVAGALLPPDFILFVALWQIPMYVMPLLIRRFLGPAP